MSDSAARAGRIRPAMVLLRTVLIAAPLVAVLAGVFLYTTHTQARLLNQGLAGEAERDLAIQRRVLLGYFEQGMRDVLLLSGAERVLDLLDEDTPRNRRRVGELFLSVLQRKGYDQVRYIDAGGMEWARANLNLNQPSIVPPGELQNKADRYYVRETLALDRDGIYVSPLDLNYEHGFMEVPLKPTLRICTPVFDRRGAKRGMLVINYLAKEALNTLGREDADTGHQTVLLAKDGYSLKSPDPNDEWGFILPARKQRNYVQRHPDVWEAMTRADKGAVHNKDGLFVFDAIRLEDQSEQWPGGPKFRVAHGSRAPGANRWLLVSFTPEAVLAARAAELRQGALAMSGLSALALLLVSGVLALSLERRRAVAVGLARKTADGKVVTERYGERQTWTAMLTSLPVKNACSSPADESHPRRMSPRQTADRLAADLLHHRDVVALLHQPRNVRFHGVMRHPAHRHALALAHRAAGQHQIQLARGGVGVVIEHFVKVAQPEHDDRVRELDLEVEILLARRSHIGHGGFNNPCFAL